MGRSTLKGGNLKMEPADLRVLGNMSTDVRMAPRPAKTPAWSHGLLPSPIDDPSSCSDNASDASDKIEGYCQPPNQTNGKTRKRKIVGNAAGPSFMNVSSTMNDGRGQHESSIQTPKDHHEARNSLTQGLWSDAELAADFDGSLSGLGADLSTSSYDMSEALLALPTIYHQQRAAAAAAAAAQAAGNGPTGSAASHNQNGLISSGFIKDSGMPSLSSSHMHGPSAANLPNDFGFDGPPPHQNSCQNGSANAHPPHPHPALDCERRFGFGCLEEFQYVLAAATSVATKVNEETLTYLNQGQPYEIKLKKLGELTAYRGSNFRSVVRLCFQDRRLQFSEREQLSTWEEAHPNESILTVDLPLSYGIHNVIQGPHADNSSNMVSFHWEPLKEVGLYIKVNCISTEFTPKKHGGEKGVPFRLMVETYAENTRLHAGVCQVKVFKLKGADRKHKQDREKILKKTPGEQAKLQPSYDCTVLSDISLESLESTPAQVHPPVHAHQGGLLSPSYSSDHPNSPENNSNSGNSSANGNNAINVSANFSAHFSPESVRRWLTRNRFSATKTLWDYNGVDLLRLSKEELVEICGLPEGTRLYNALHFKITFYILLPSNKDNQQDSSSSPSSCGDENVYHPICLSAPSITEMTSVVGSLFYSQFPNDTMPVERLLLSVLAPGASSRIRVHLTEQLLSTLKDQTAFKASKTGNEVHLEIDT